MPKRDPTTKDIALLLQLHEDGQLHLAPEFQRNSVWPPAAKAYLIDTILKDRPIPLIFIQRSTSPQTGRPNYSVIDGQQRLRAVIDFTQDRFGLTQSSLSDSYHRKKFSQLSDDEKEQIRNYAFVVQELHGYSQADIRDCFIRMNRFVVKLSQQELRHAREEGKFADFVERLGNWGVWKEQRIFTPTQLKRMRAVEFAAELAILLIEGPQDKKSSIDLYYVEHRNRFPYARSTESRLRNHLDWVRTTIPSFSSSRYRKPVDLYALIGALDELENEGVKIDRLPKKKVGQALTDFEQRTRSKQPARDAARYLVAASRQTDNVVPRETRIRILRDVISKSG